ncbi:hypothetical protein ACCO45_005770, partial [Purpureocillium lilacinum]
KNPIPSPSCPAQLPRLSLAVRRHHKPPPPAALALLSNTHHPHPPPQPPGATTSRPHAAAAAAAPPRDDSSRPRLSPARAHAFAFASPPQVRSTPQLFFPDLLDTPSAPRVSYRPRPSSTNLVHRSSRTPLRACAQHSGIPAPITRAYTHRPPSPFGPLRSPAFIMGRTRRGVRFNHNGQIAGSDGRRSSFSGSEDGSGSPTRTRSKAQAQLEPVQEKQPTPEEEYQKKKANFMTRTFWTFSMLAIFFGALFMGHIYIIAIVTAVQIVSFKEVIAIANVPSRARSIRSTKSLNWYWLATTMYFLYGESVIYYFKHIVLVDKVLLPLATHHRFISFILYVFGFVSFVATLKAGHYKFQFTNFAWTHMALYLIVVQAHFVMNNIFEGMIWFFLPAALVITNDIFAYVCGIAFGRTQLIKLSPKKTVEGFVGAWIMTLLWAMLLVNLMIRSKYFICPVNDLGATIFTGLECDPNPVFVPRTYQLPHFFFLPPNTNMSLTFAPMQIHALVLASFASLIAPFGGFFASGLKRTFKIKDFGDSIPGHGGMTDRMDCQFIMGFFAYMYYHTFIAVHQVTLGSVLETAITSLGPDEQVELVKSMARYLGNQGVVPETFLDCVEKTIVKR